MSDQEWQAWAEGDDPDATPPGIDPYPPDDFGPEDEGPEGETEGSTAPTRERPA